MKILTKSSKVSRTFSVFYFLLRLLYAISSLLIAASKKVVGAKNPAINIWSYCWANVKGSTRPAKIELAKVGMSYSYFESEG